jgi:hypothetical protein
MSSWRTRALAYLESKLEEGDRLILERVLQERATAVAIPATGSSSPTSEVSPQRRPNPLPLTKGAWNQFCGRWWRELGTQKVVVSDLLDIALVDPAFAEVLGSKNRASQITRLAAEILPRVGLGGYDFKVEIAGRGKSNFYRLTHSIDPETAQSLRGFLSVPGVIATQEELDADGCVISETIEVGSGQKPSSPDNGNSSPDKEGSSPDNVVVNADLGDEYEAEGLDAGQAPDPGEGYRLLEIGEIIPEEAFPWLDVKWALTCTIRTGEVFTGEAERNQARYYRVPVGEESKQVAETAPEVKPAPKASSPVSQAPVQDSVPSRVTETSSPRPKPWLSGWRMPERLIGQPWEDWIRSGLSTLPALTLDHIRLDLDKVILCVRDRELGPLKLAGRYGVSPATVAVALTECEPLIRAMDGMPEGSQYKFLEILRKQLQGVK